MAISVCLLWAIAPQSANADLTTKVASYVAKQSAKIPAKTFAAKPVKTIKVLATAYSSSVDETDSDPFITASGKRVADGIVANNLLPLGTKIRIPKLYGDKVFTVYDRMNKRKGNYHIDLWMPSKTLALNFGVKSVEIEVLEN